MDCLNCEKHMNYFLEGKLSPDQTAAVEQHMNSCPSCLELHNTLLFVEQLIQKDRRVVPSSGLTDRVMNSILAENKIIRLETRIQQILQPLLIAASITLAILGGISIGNSYNGNKSAQNVPIELALMDDLSIESFDMITQ